MKLYHYVHCPFCLRVRMALGFLNISYESIVVDYDNEELPIRLCGKKMLPILEFKNGKNYNESLDIIKKLDENDLLETSLLNDKIFEEISLVIDDMSKYIYKLTMPYFIWTPEFNQSSREYFRNKKEKSRGLFKDLMKSSEQFTNKLIPLLDNFERKIDKYYYKNKFTILDILIASHLWSLYIVPEFQFSIKVHNYLQNIKYICSFNYHCDYFN